MTPQQRPTTAKGAPNIGPITSTAIRPPALPTKPVPTTSGTSPPSTKSAPSRPKNSSPPSQQQSSTPSPARTAPPPTPSITTKKGRSPSTKNSERDAGSLPVKDVIWVDRIAKELKAQREWNAKWSFMFEDEIPTKSSTTDPHIVFNRSRNLNRGTLASYNGSVYVTKKTQHLKDQKQNNDDESLYSKPPPMQRYAHPATSNMEYGWNWGGVKTLERYGSTSANFTRESWKRASLGS
ncbi:hypothetical protein HDU76_013113 [Blyttiomyces sp. JEL0837]|nr:hypothetical protein HDU76_013113 [Blyttiomyces sp. JEL0837]